jgi:Putative MetA-pathway of phenol degradation
MRAVAFVPLAASIAASAVEAGQPLVTDDAAVVQAKTCQVEAWTRSLHDGREYWVLPACNPFEALELSAGGARADASENGWSTQAQLQAKAVLNRSPGDEWSFGALAGMQRDTAAPHGRSAFQTIYGKALASYYPDPSIELDLNLGVAHTYKSGSFALAGVAVQYRVVERLQLLLEAFRDEPGRAKYQTGVRLAAVPNRLELYVSYGNRIGNISSDWWSVVGIRLQSTEFLP